MYKLTKFVSILLFITIMIFNFSVNSIASDYPNKSIDLIVPWSSGGITDTTARAFAPHFEKHLNESVTIVNRPVRRASPKPCRHLPDFSGQNVKF
jgi:tripartite-type tricarboxylate transporter receptor subunit TctC